MVLKALENRQLALNSYGIGGDGTTSFASKPDRARRGVAMPEATATAQPLQDTACNLSIGSGNRGLTFKAIVVAHLLSLSPAKLWRIVPF